jgi:DNA-binding transcriptional LysR family regulator
VAETGSLTGAARALGRSQPTLGRQVQALETQLGIALFDRHPRGFALSEAGEQLLDPARKMRDAMRAIELAAAGRSTRLDGTVRITASVFASHHVLPPILAAIRAAEPAIQLELAPSDMTENLLFREADIAVRMYRPAQLDIITRHIGDIALGVFAARSYLDRAGRPETIADLWDHDLIGYDRNDLILTTMRAMGWDATRDSFAVRCDNQTAYWELLRAGCGIGFSQLSVGRADPAVEEIPLDLGIPPLHVWLAAHQAMRRTPRVRRVWDLLADGLARQLS